MADQYEYKVVPFEGSLTSRQSVGDVSQQLQQIINQNVEGGWEFYTVDDVNIRVQPGCLGSIMGKTTSHVSYDQVIFRRERH